MNTSTRNSTAPKVITGSTGRPIERKEPSKVVPEEIVKIHWDLPEAKDYRDAMDTFDKAADRELKIATEFEVTVTRDFRTVDDLYKASLRDGRKASFEAASKELALHLDKTARLRDELSDARKAIKQANARLVKTADRLDRFAALSKRAPIGEVNKTPAEAHAFTLEQMLGAHSPVFNASGKIVSGGGGLKKLDPIQQENIKHIGSLIHAAWECKDTIARLLTEMDELTASSLDVLGLTDAQLVRRYKTASGVAFARKQAAADALKSLALFHKVLSLLKCSNDLDAAVDRGTDCVLHMHAANAATSIKGHDDGLMQQVDRAFQLETSADAGASLALQHGPRYAASYALSGFVLASVLACLYETPNVKSVITAGTIGAGGLGTLSYGGRMDLATKIEFVMALLVVIAAIHGVIT